MMFYLYFIILLFKFVISGWDVIFFIVCIIRQKGFQISIPYLVFISFHVCSIL